MKDNFKQIDKYCKENELYYVQNFTNSDILEFYDNHSGIMLFKASKYISYDDLTAMHNHGRIMFVRGIKAGENNIRIQLNQLFQIEE